MQWSLRSHLLGAWTTFVGLAASAIASPCAGEEPAADYTLVLNAPPDNRACNSRGWFITRFEQIRGEKRFAKPSKIEVSVMKDGTSGFTLDVFLRYGSNGPTWTSTRMSYSEPTECTQVVADAAEIVVQMMHGHPPRPQAAPPSFDYDVEIDAPDWLAPCGNTHQWRKFFEYARGKSRFLAPYPKRVELTFGGKSGEKIVVLGVIRGPDGRPILGPDGRSLNDLRWSYPNPVECTQALAYSAQSVSNLMAPPTIKPPPPPPPPPPKRPTRLFSLGLGVASFTNIFFGTTGLGAQLTLDAPIRPSWSVRTSLTSLYPTLWTLRPGAESEHPYKYTSSTMFIGALDLCYRIPYLAICGRGNFGAGELRGVGTRTDEGDVASYVSIGPHLSASFPRLRPGDYGKFQFVMGGGYYFQLVSPEVGGSIAGPAYNKIAIQFAKPSHVSGSLIVGVTYSFQ